MENFTANEAREAFESSGLDYSDISLKDLAHLRDLINQELSGHTPLRGSMICQTKIKSDFSDDGEMRSAFIFCDGFYFSKREAVSFNSDGFIGFAGWASTTNLHPITRGFIAWLDAIT